MFTPVEFGTVGLSEEKAIQCYGHENIEVRMSALLFKAILNIHFAHNLVNVPYQK